MLGGSRAPWEEHGLPHPAWLAAWKSLQLPFHCRQAGGGAGMCTLEKENYGASGAEEHAQGTDALLLHEQHQERARCARNCRSCFWAQGGITPKPLCFCNAKVETERQGRVSPTRSSLPVRCPAATRLRVWGSWGLQHCRPAFQHHFCGPSGGGIRYCPQWECPQWELSTIKNPAISG